MDDIDRIEVIRGPGGTIWGPNAVDGVINIITKNSKQTRGTLANIASAALGAKASWPARRFVCVDGRRQ